MNLDNADEMKEALPALSDMRPTRRNFWEFITKYECCPGKADKVISGELLDIPADSPKEKKFEV